MSVQKTKISILISGNGTNLQSIIDACKDHTLSNSQVVRVISNRIKAYGLIRAKDAGIPTHYHNLPQYKKKHPENIDLAREEYDKDLAILLLADEPDLVVCAGFMHVLSEQFLNPLAEARLPIVNLHPALPGQFSGANAIERAHEQWMRGEIDHSGIMLHYVVSEVDMGEPILVEEIPFIKGVDEDIEKFEQRVHAKEWKLIVQGTKIAIERLERREPDGE